MKPALEKLPLIARKDVRDNWEAKKPDLEKRYSDLLGIPWTLSANVLQTHAYAEDSYSTSNPGGVVYAYFEGGLEGLEKLISKYGEMGKDEVNTQASKHEATLTVSESEKIYYSGCDISDGVLRLLFKPDAYGSNIGDVTAAVDQALSDLVAAGTTGSTAPAAPEISGSAGDRTISLIARQSIRLDYDPHINQLREDIAKLVNVPDIKLLPNFSANFVKLQHAANTGKMSTQNWQGNFGSTALAYFQSVKYYLERDGFAGDEMLQEGFAEAVEYKRIEVRIVEKLGENSYYNEAVVSEGVLYLQTLVDEYGTNRDGIAEKLLSLL